MGMFTDFAQNKLTDALLRGQALGAPATLYYELLTCTKGARANSTVYALNDTFAVTANDGKIHLYKCTAAGITAAAQASLYPGVANEAIVDGTATFAEQNAALDAGTAMTPPSGGSYARASVVASLANHSGTQGAGTTVASSGTTGSSSNNVAITFPTPTADWTPGTVKAWGVAIYDAPSGGNPWVWAPLVILQSLLNGQSAPSFALSSVTLTIGN